jgi:hypothetical protein
MMDNEADYSAVPAGRPAKPQIVVALGGSLLRVRRAYQPMATRTIARRGAIRAFSRGSRNRLIDFLASINRSTVRHLPLFVTLTYPATYPTEGAIVKTHLDRWLKRLQREYPFASAVWKMEYQKRGAPHFHLLVFGCSAISVKWLARSWYEVVGSGDERHLKAGTQVKRVKSWQGVMFYAGKYLAKVTGVEVPDHPGRFWGVFNRVAFPIDIVRFRLTFAQFWLAARLYRRFRRVQHQHVTPIGRRGQGFKLYKDGVQQAVWLRAIMGNV